MGARSNAFGRGGILEEHPVDDCMKKAHAKDLKSIDGVEVAAFPDAPAFESWLQKNYQRWKPESPLYRIAQWICLRSRRLPSPQLPIL